MCTHIETYFSSNELVKIRIVTFWDRDGITTQVVLSVPAV